MGTAIATKGRGGRLLIGRRNYYGRRSHYRLSRGAAGVLAVTVERQRHNDGERNGTAKEAGPLVAVMGRRLARSGDGRTGGTTKVLRPFLPLAVEFDFERESFSDTWATTIFRKCRDVNKDIGATLSWRNEPEASIVIPLCESAFDAHMK